MITDYKFKKYVWYVYNMWYVICGLIRKGYYKVKDYYDDRDV